VDGLPATVVGESAAFPHTTLKSLSLESLSDAIVHALKAIKSTATGPDGQSSKPLVVIDGLDFMLASQSDLDVMEIQSFLSRSLTLASSLVISCNADTPLLHNREEAATPLEREHAAFVTIAAHQARYVLQLRGLDTGAARDVTGVLRISPGGGYEATHGQNEVLPEGEWLYQCKGDGSVRVWSRGE
jgi:elongator complex protein 6